MGKEENNNIKKFSYLKYLLLGAATGVAIGIAANPTSTADQIGHGFTNMFIYGAIGFGLCALKNRDYKKLWFVPAIAITGFVVIFLALVDRPVSSLLATYNKETESAFMPATLSQKTSPTPFLISTPTQFPTMSSGPSPEPQIQTTAPGLSPGTKQVEEWRIPFMVGHMNDVYDTKEDLNYEFERMIYKNAEAIEAPYRWEYYTIDASFKNVSDYYIPLMRKKGFQVTQNYYNQETSTGFITFLSPNQVAYVQFRKGGIVLDRNHYNFFITNVTVIYKKICPQEEFQCSYH